MVDRLLEIYRDTLAHPSGGPFFENLLSLLNVNPLITRQDLARIPATGAVVAVANHPFGMIESSILGALLPTVRPDVKFIARSLLCQLFPAIADRIIAVNPFGGEAATKATRKGMREALLHLKAGGMLVVFPAGEVAHLNLQKRQITDPEWSTTIARLVRMTKSPVLPIYFAGANSAWFQVLSVLHPRVRTDDANTRIFQQAELRSGNADRIVDSGKEVAGHGPRRGKGYRPKSVTLRYYRCG